MRAFVITTLLLLAACGIDGEPLPPEGATSEAIGGADTIFKSGGGS